MSRNIYFASDKAEITVATLNEKAKSWFTGISQSSYSDKIEKSWRAYYGDYYGDNSAHELSFGG